MAERFEVINKNTSISILKGCPVIIEAFALLKDNKTGTAVAQIKMCNLSEKNIIAVKVSIEAFEISGARVTGVDAFSFLDIRIIQGESFGDRSPITLPNSTTRIIKPCIIEVVFEDNTVWEHEATEWEMLKATAPFPFKETELQKQYIIETKSKCKNYPMVEQGFFVCSCGNINIEGNACFRCGAAFEDLMTPLLDPEAFKARAESRVIAEEYDLCCSEQEKALSAEELRSIQKRFEKLGDYKDSAKRKLVCEKIATQLEEEARQLEKKRQEEKERRILEEKEREAKRKKRRLYIIIFSIVGSVILIVAITLSAPYLNKVSQYNSAKELLDNGKYNEAQAAFEALGTFSNADEMIQECIYQEATSLMSKKRYEAAIPLFEQISTYKDSQQLQDDCKQAIEDEIKAKEEAEEERRKAEEERLQTAYDNALALLNRGKWEEAYNAFIDLGDYKDSSTKAYEAVYEALVEPYKNSEEVYLKGLLDALEEFPVNVSDISSVKAEIRQLINEITGYYLAPAPPNLIGEYGDMTLEINGNDTYEFGWTDASFNAKGTIMWAVKDGKIDHGLGLDTDHPNRWFYCYPTEDGIDVPEQNMNLYRGYFTKQ